MLFISALAQGLAKENVSGVEQWNKSEYNGNDADNNSRQSDISGKNEESTRVLQKVTRLELQCN